MTVLTFRNPVCNSNACLQQADPCFKKVFKNIKLDRTETSEKQQVLQKLTTVSDLAADCIAVAPLAESHFM